MTFIIAMILMLAFAFICRMIVGGTGGWISFCAASSAILTIATTAISVTGEGEK